MKSMFTAEPENTMLDNVESYLAYWTGKTQWPYAQAILESRLSIPTGDGEHRWASQYAIFTYAVDGKVYQASVREVAGLQERPWEVGSKVTIQYNPAHPSAFYYAPACRLANRLLIASVIGIGGVCIALAIRLS
jgi:hypothetical protein